MQEYRNTADAGIRKNNNRNNNTNTIKRMNGRHNEND